MVTAESFSKVYGHGRHKVMACSCIDFRAEDGGITGLLGANGAGKTSLLKALCGMHYASSGTVRVCEETDSAIIRRIAGFVPETPELDGALTVKETLHQEALLHGIIKSRVFIEVERVLKSLELEEVLNKKTSVLSKGFRQRLSLAKALVFNPKVLILDEFSGGLDPAQIISVRNLIKSFSKSGTVILSTHNIEEAHALCSYIYIMNRGKIIANGTAEDITVSTGKKTLEDAFIWLTRE